MSSSQRRRHDPALQGAECVVSRLCAANVNASSLRKARNLSPIDALAPGEALVVYAEGALNGGSCTLIISINTIAAAVDRVRVLNVAQQRHHLLTAAQAMFLDARRQEANVERQTVAEWMLTIVALLLTNVDLAALRRIDDGVPAVVIVARTERRGRPTVETMHAVTRFPGQWLGTTEVSGRG